MKSWRDRGFVLDSDDEDRATVHSQPTSHIEDENATLSQPAAARDGGDGPCGSPCFPSHDHEHEHTTCSKWPDNTVGANAGSSPIDGQDSFTAIESVIHPVTALDLTTHETLPAQYQGSLDHLQDDFVVGPLASTTARVSPPVTDSHSRDADRSEVAIELASGLYAPQRNLRVRKAVQLHPYQVLDALYQKQMHARGLAATRVILPSSNRIRKRSSQSDADNEERGDPQSSLHSQSADSQTMLHSDDVDLNAIGGNESTTAGPYFGSAASTIVMEDLPDLQDMLRVKDSMWLPRSRKRRKLRNIPGNALPVGSVTDGGARSSNGFVVDPAVPSPAGSDCSLASDSDASVLPLRRKKKIFRAPPGMSPTNLPTPVTSSSVEATGRRMFRHVAISSSPLGHPEGYDMGQSVNEPRSPGDPSSPSSEDIQIEQGQEAQENILIHAMQKRIKGVLPASWLKLDAKARKPPATSQAHFPLRDRAKDDGQQAGLARRVIKARKHSTSIFDLYQHESQSYVASMDSSPIPDLQSNSPLSRAASVLTAPWLPLYDGDPGLGMEDNTVDTMSPSIPRPYRSRKRSRKRQTRLTDTCHEQSNQPDTFITSNRAPRLHVPHSTTIKPKFKLPRLGILDAGSSNTDNLLKPPAFLKIAKREAQRRLGNGRMKLQNKAIRLQTREDTVDVQKVMNDWRAGILTERSIPEEGRAPRKPLEPLNLEKFQPIVPYFARGALERCEALVDSVNQFQQNQQQKEQQQQWRGKKSSHQPKLLRASGSESDRLAKSMRLLAPKRQSVLSKRNQVAQLEADANNIHFMPDRLQFRRQMLLADQDPTEAQGDFTSHDGPKRAQALLLSHPDASITSKAKSGIDSRSSPSMRRRVRRRKSLPQRIDTEASEYRQPDIFFVPPACGSESVVSLDRANGDALHDLQPYGIPYAHDFGILPLPGGTYFHDSTFIGSGDFKKALVFPGRSLDIEVARHAFEYEGRHCSWGVWNEEMITDARHVFTMSVSILESLSAPQGPQHRLGENQSRLRESILVMRKLSRLNCECLSFSDSVDRNSFTQCFLDLIKDIFIAADDLCSSRKLQEYPDLAHTMLGLLSSLLVLGGQVSKVAAQCDDLSLKKASHVLLKELAILAMSQLSCHGFDFLRQFYGENERLSIRETGVRAKHAAVELVVVAFNMFEDRCVYDLSFWDIFKPAALPSILTTRRVSILEMVWYDLFTILPLLEVNSAGLIQLSNHSRSSQESWALVRALLTRAFVTYDATSRISGSTINDYLRALLSRCFLLVQNWAWRSCDAIVSCIFDFFARRGYTPLQNEVRRSSPYFLEHLAQDPVLELSADDQCFHIFLKTIAIGLISMRNWSTDKQIRAIAWRWLPNHNRTYNKDKDLRHDDLDALRNQHDLLSTLFWASPTGFRPRLNMIQDLVDHANSHREACRLNIKAWSNLATFQLSVAEPLDAVLPFSYWLKDILEQNAAQFRLARAELEDQNQLAMQSGYATVSSDRLEIMISRNESSIAASLCDALAGMTNAIEQAHSVEAAWTLLRESHIDVLFSLHNAQSKKSMPTLHEIFRLFDGFLRLVNRQCPQMTPHMSSDESQEYGDWPEDDLIETKSTTQASLEFILESAWILLRNVFGSDTSPDESILTQAVETWSRIVVTMVERNYADMQSFIGEYGKSWNQLRETAQRHVYGPYFFACLVQLDRTAMGKFGGLLRANWLASLMERDAQLKFQHILTSHLLDAYPNDPLLHNLPFHRCQSGDKYEISFIEFRQGRLGLLSSIFSNMRSDLASEAGNESDAWRSTRTEYAHLLSTIMGRMKENYQGLRQQDVSKDSYITFVQNVVEYMQQYTATDICPVDRWFTDSAAFPLPAHDPAYLVGKLRGYEAKLDDLKAAKQLIMFFQNISERALVDDQQEYFVVQLMSIVNESFDDETTSKASVKSMLLGVICPVYIETAFDDAIGWIFARPILNICAQLGKSLIYNISISEAQAVEAILPILVALLSAVRNAAAHLEFLPEQIQRPHIQALLALMIDAVSHIMPIVDFIETRTGLGLVAGSMARYFGDFTLFVGKILLQQDDAFPPTFLGTPPTLRMPWAELRPFCWEQLKETRDSKWREQNGHYQVKKGNTWVEVKVEIDSAEQVKAELIAKIEELHFIFGCLRCC